MTTMATVQRKKRRMDRKLAPSGKGETVSVTEGPGMVRTPRAGGMPFETQGKPALPVCDSVWEKPLGSADSPLRCMRAQRYMRSNGPVFAGLVLLQCEKGAIPTTYVCCAVN